MERVLVALDDSSASLAAARLAVDLAKGWGARVLAITVTDHPGATDRGPAGTGPAGTGRETERNGHAGGIGSRLPPMLAYATRLGERRGVAVEVAVEEGVPFECILAAAGSWRAQLIVMGRSARHGPGSAYLGSETAHVLEFTDRPVLVVPEPSPGTG